MRREGYELQVSQPQVIIKNEVGEDGKEQKLEPFEEVTIGLPRRRAGIPAEYQGAIIERLGLRAFVMKDLKMHDQAVRIIFEGPSRGLLGYRNQFVVDTKGEGIMASRVIGFKPYAGE